MEENPLGKWALEAVDTKQGRENKKRTEWWSPRTKPRKKLALNMHAVQYTSSSKVKTQRYQTTMTRHSYDSNQFNNSADQYRQTISPQQPARCWRWLDAWWLEAWSSRMGPPSPLKYGGFEGTYSILLAYFECIFAWPSSVWSWISIVEEDEPRLHLIEVSASSKYAKLKIQYNL